MEVNLATPTFVLKLIFRVFLMEELRSTYSFFVRSFVRHELLIRVNEEEEEEGEEEEGGGGGGGGYGGGGGRKREGGGNGGEEEDNVT